MPPMFTATGRPSRHAAWIGCTVGELKTVMPRGGRTTQPDASRAAIAADRAASGVRLVRQAAVTWKALVVASILPRSRSAAPIHVNAPGILSAVSSGGASDVVFRDCSF